MEIVIHIHHHHDKPPKRVERCPNCQGSGIATIEFALKGGPHAVPLGPNMMGIAPGGDKEILLKERTCPSCVGKGIIEV